jgi:GTPase Era involved in 16S rRNA processing
MIREQLFTELGEEIPYACYVEIGSLENTDTLLKIQGYINTESDSQKTIVIGK